MTITTETINGHTYRIGRNGAGEIIFQAAADLPVSLPIALSKFAFRMLFTLPEQVAIDSFGENPALTLEQKANLRTFIFNFQIADTITLNHPMTIAGVQALETYGLIVAGRADQILANQKPQ